MGVLPGGWVLDGLSRLAPWVSVVQSGSGDVPSAVVLTAFDGEQVEFTNTLAGSGATGGVWAAPVQVGWPSGQFGSLVDDGDLAASGSVLTWSSGQEVVTFQKSAPGVWSVVESKQVGPGGLVEASVQAVWDRSVSPPRLSGLVDPASAKTVSFLYGSGGSCGGVAPPVDGSDTYLAPDGLLCGWSNFDGRTTHVWYVTVADGADVGAVVDGFQVGWVQGPGGAGVGENTQLSWNSDGGVSWPQLAGVQMPLGYDAQAKVGLAESETVWSVNYDEFGNVSSVVSPVPGVSSVVAGANTDRVARVFIYNESQGVQWTTVSHGEVFVDFEDGLEVVPGATVVDEVRFDGAWRPVRYAVVSSRPAGGFFFVNKTWDTVNDRLLAVEDPNGRQTVSVYDYLGRVTDRWGPAPTASFTTDGDGQVVPASGFDDSNLIRSSKVFDVGTNGELVGLTASMYASGTPGGVPAGTVGSCADGQCGDPAASSPLLWTVLPAGAGVSGGGWSMNVVASREAPVDGGQLRYRVSTDGDGSVLSFAANGSCNTVFTSASCAGVVNETVTVAVPPTTQAGEPVTLQVQYRRGGTAVSAVAPVTVTIEESIDGGANWTDVTAGQLDPGFGLTSSNSHSDTFVQGGPVVTSTATPTYVDPQRQQIATATVSTDGVTAAMGHTFETYDGSTTWGRTLTTTDLAGTTVSADYWGPTDTTTNPCDGSTSVAQAGLQRLFTTAETTSGDPAGSTIGRVYDAAGRPVAQTYTSEDGQVAYTVCREFGPRDQPLRLATTDNTLSTSYVYPWADPTSSNAFTTTMTHLAPDTTGTTQTYGSSSTIDLLGRTVASTDPWGTTTVVDHAVDPVTGVRTITATSTTAVGFVVTDTLTANADGTTANRVRADASTTLTAAYTYNADSTVDTVTISDGSNEIITETR
ncbi:MAG: hypothetical protein AAGA42_13165, partial [Actinomycetota bacterium]